MNAPFSQNQPVLSHFKNFYKDMKAESYIKLPDIYANDVVFRDPVHEIQGLANLMSYMDASVENLQECRFEFLDELIGDGVAYIKWNMHYLHPRINKQVQTLRGVSHLYFDEKITFHEDVYDMGALVYEHLPLLGFATTMVKRRIANF